MVNSHRDLKMVAKADGEVFTKTAKLVERHTKGHSDGSFDLSSACHYHLQKVAAWLLPRHARITTRQRPRSPRPQGPRLLGPYGVGAPRRRQAPAPIDGDQRASFDPLTVWRSSGRQPTPKNLANSCRCHASAG